VPEPFVTALTSRGDTLVVYPYQATIPGLPTLTTFTTTALIEKDADLVADFATAMKEALEWAQNPANEAAVRQAIKDNLELPEAVADTVRLPEFGWDLDRASMEELAELAVKYGVLDRKPNFDRLIQQH
jgi:NitT/TauT family transport system substrate-binding protein